MADIQNQLAWGPVCPSVLFSYSVLFFTYINDLPSTVSSQVRLFADDCLLYRLIKCRADQEQLQRDLTRPTPALPGGSTLHLQAALLCLSVSPGHSSSWHCVTDTGGWRVRQRHADAVKRCQITQSQLGLTPIMWNSITLTSFVFTELANKMKYGGGVLYIVFTEWRHCVSQNNEYRNNVSG